MIIIRASIGINVLAFVIWTTGAKLCSRICREYYVSLSFSLFRLVITVITINNSTNSISIVAASTIMTSLIITINILRTISNITIYQTPLPWLIIFIQLKKTRWHSHSHDNHDPNPAAAGPLEDPHVVPHHQCHLSLHFPRQQNVVTFRVDFYFCSYFPLFPLSLFLQYILYYFEFSSVRIRFTLPELQHLFDCKASYYYIQRMKNVHYLFIYHLN